MKKLMLSAAAVALTAGYAMANDNGSDTMVLNGDIPDLCTVSVEGGSTKTVNIADAQGVQQLGAIEVECNLDGFTLSVTTANGFELENEDDSQSLDYTLALAQDGGTALDSAASGTDISVDVAAFDSNIAAGVEVDVSLDITENAINVPGGTQMTDTITFTVAPTPAPVEAP